MYRILYISTARTPFTPADVETVLAISRRNNRTVQVTGLLVVGGRRFLQVLEGPEYAVRATFERIKGDPRHFAVVILHEGDIATRAFADWSMGCQTLAIAGAEPDLAAIIAAIPDANLRAYFAGFTAEHHQRAA